jgi:hypothetical protein
LFIFILHCWIEMQGENGNMPRLFLPGFAKIPT